MKRRNFIVVIATAVFFIFGRMFWLCIFPTSPAPQLSLPSPSPSAQTTQAVQTTSAVPILRDDGSPISLKTMSRDKATWIYAHRAQKDVYYDWKQPIDFFGKVVDQNNRPVADASVHMTWTTLGVPGGSLAQEIKSDQGGLFSLTQQTGKELEIRVEKNGYYTVEGGNGPVSFEYANPSDPGYYEPDAGNPVVFHLRKKGLDAANLLHWQRNVAVNAQNQKALDLKTGQTTDGSTPSLSVDVLENSGKFGAFAWSARVSVTGGGGLQLTTDQFAFVAPAGGYQQSVDVNMTSAKPPVWNGGAGGAFYVQTPQGYGRYTISMAVGVSSMQVEGYFNPTPGDRNLEPASN